MKQLLNTLFVTSEDIYLSLEGENVLASRDKTVIARYPLHTLQAIVSFSYAGASPALMGKCAEAGIGLAFCSPHGRFLARICGESSGNVLLRREQYRIADDPARSCEIARTMIFGKLCNGAASIQRTLRDHAPRVADCGLENAAANIRDMLPQVLAAADLDTLRGIEGAAATAYFGVFDHMLLNRKEAFFFHGRSRRPPLDRVNAMLSFAYSLLAHDCASALESVGPDSYVGFLHRDRPGRQSLALDLMEELPGLSARKSLPFVITISREYGSGGHRIGERLAQRLGVKFYDRELISLTAQQSGLGESTVQESEQTVSGRLMYDDPVQTAVFRAQSQVIRNIACQEPCVIVGRLANFVLKDRPACLHLFIYADEATRRKRIASEYGVADNRTQSLLKRIDQERREHCLHYTGCEWGERHYYHMMLDSSISGDEQIVETIRNVIRTVSGRKHPNGRKK